MPHEHQDGFARPSDVPEYVEQPVVYASGAEAHIIGDGVGTRGSPMPVLATQLADIPSTAEGWLVSGELPEDVPDPATGEAKFRFHMNVSHILPDDPIRNYGHPGASHLHTFFGSTTTNANSTFASLRNRANELAAAGRAASTSSGGPYNGTGYWMPAMMNGDFVVKPGQIFGYYTSNPATDSYKAQRIPRGLRYVAGYNMDDPTDSAIKAEIAAANALPGNSGRYQYAGNGFIGWLMLEADLATPILTTEGETHSPCIKNLDGSDPWGGAAGAGCWLKATVLAPQGYDGTNLWSPGGYKHMRQEINDGNIGRGCLPQGWYYLPRLEIIPFFQHQGWADYQNWRLSSDDHAAMVLGEDVANGTSFHVDWFGAWDDSVFGADTGWQIQCVGVKDGAVFHECASGCFSADGMRLLGSIGVEAAPDGSRNPQVGLPELYDTSDPADMFAVPDAFTGPVTVPARRLGE